MSHCGLSGVMSTSTAEARNAASAPDPVSASTSAASVTRCIRVGCLSKHQFQGKLDVARFAGREHLPYCRRLNVGRRQAEGRCVCQVEELRTELQHQRLPDPEV